ncbi:MAG TPA: copper-binding protein [Sutterella sp.]|nr:copper-binding protein [Sutterella sp.]
MKTQIRIDGMHCEHCAKAASKALGALPGVSSVSVDLTNKAALVQSVMPLDEKAVRAALEKEEFTLVSMQEV